MLGSDWMVSYTLAKGSGEDVSVHISAVTEIRDGLFTSVPRGYSQFVKVRGDRARVIVVSNLRFPGCRHNCRSCWTWGRRELD